MNKLKICMPLKLYLKLESFVSYALPTDIFIRHGKNRCSDKKQSPMTLARTNDWFRFWRDTEDSENDG